MSEHKAKPKKPKVNATSDKQSDTAHTNAGSDKISEAQKNANNPKDMPKEYGGPEGPEPTRYGDWEVGGRCSDF